MLEYSMLYPKSTVSRRAVSMDGMWKFQIDWQGTGEKDAWTGGIPGDEFIPVPASFQDFYTEKEVREFAGDVWYEKDMFVPGEWKGSRVFIRFGAATHRALVHRLLINQMDTPNCINVITFPMMPFIPCCQ